MNYGREVQSDIVLWCTHVQYLLCEMSIDIKGRINITHPIQSILGRIHEERHVIGAKSLNKRSDCFVLMCFLILFVFEYHVCEKVTTKASLASHVFQSPGPLGKVDKSLSNLSKT